VSGGSAGRSIRHWLTTIPMVGVVYVAVFLFYELIYRVRHFSLPLGFDAPWYVLRRRDWGRWKRMRGRDRSCSRPTCTR